MKKYQFSFEPWGLFLFAVIMLPNILWFAVPAPNDVLRRESVTPVLDAAAQLFQVLLVLTLCAMTNRQSRKPMHRGFRLGIWLFVVLYYIGWMLYYAGMANAAVILDLCIAPCMAFLVFSAARKNVLSLMFAGAFMVCHVISGAANFVGFLG